MSGTVFAKAPAVCGSSVPLFVMPGRGLHIDDADRPAYQCLSSYFSMVTRLMKPIGPKNLHMRPPPSWLPLLLFSRYPLPRSGCPIIARPPSRLGFCRIPNFWALIEFRGDGGASHDQSRDEGAEESFAPAPGVVHELEEAEIQRQLLLRDAPVWPQPGA